MNSRKPIGSGLFTLVFGLILATPGCDEGKHEAGLKFSDCPTAVQKTIIDHAGGIQFSGIDKESKKDGRVVYEAKAKKADGKEIKIKVAGDGRLVEFKDEDGS